MAKFAVISEIDWPVLLVVEATSEAQALEIAIAKTIKWCQEMDSDWVMRLRPDKYCDDELGCHGHPIRWVILEPANEEGPSGIIKLWMPHDPNIEKCSQY